MKPRKRSFDQMSTYELIEFTNTYHHRSEEFEGMCTCGLPHPCLVAELSKRLTNEYVNAEYLAEETYRAAQEA